MSRGTDVDHCEVWGPEGVPSVVVFVVRESRDDAIKVDCVWGFTGDLFARVRALIRGSALSVHRFVASVLLPAPPAEDSDDDGEDEQRASDDPNSDGDDLVPVVLLPAV